MSEDFTQNIDDMSDVELRVRLQDLRRQHRLIDQEIKALYEIGSLDMLKLARMKKIKLRFKDAITEIEEELTPDIIA